jgi:hypothetical protein
LRPRQRLKRPAWWNQNVTTAQEILVASNTPWAFYLRFSSRKIIETTISLIECVLPKSIHSVTAEGFELKVGLFALACSLNFL